MAMKARVVRFLVVISFALPFATAQGQEGRERSVRIDTPDGVELRAHYYRGKGRGSPCVLMVHEWGKSSRIGPWKDLAHALNKKGFAVLTFDLRGHGLSTTVDESI